ncbi:hypothetical protein VTK26DRAFT_8510 [Humicola hyalothermophila]
MGRPPAYLFVVRHGYRLDAADKQWHLSSPAPYDPPLTYGGWQQAKNLGARIASILHDRVKEDELAASRVTDPSTRPKRKRYEVVLHSSPFLRCIQTSIAISAGLAVDSTPFGPPPSQPSTSSAASSPPNATRHPSPPIVTNMQQQTNKPPIRRTLLRLDAFLGEWLSPNYFELITPPPESVMMLAGAKADLLRREDYSQYPNFSSGNSYAESQGQLWSPASRGSLGHSQGEGRSNALGTMSSLANSLPNSTGTGTDNNGQRQQPEATGYMSPVPHYAVNNNNTIPPGYVSHARDACVDIDYQWDTTRPPLDWGDGGEFPEEWSDMHKRFRTGVQRLIDWYSTTDNPTVRTATRARKESTTSMVDDLEDVETESVVILVSHGAGCNALIGAITHQPVLMDVGMTSLTMATRKPGVGDNLGQVPASPAGSKTGPPIHELYEMQLVASTDHIKAQSPTTTPGRSPSLAHALNGARSRHSSISAPSSYFSWGDRSGSRGSSANAALGGIRRSPNSTPPSVVPRISLSLNTPSDATTTSRPSSNLGRTPSLWTPISSRDEEKDDDEEDDLMLLNFSHEKPSSTSTSTTASTTQTQTTRLHAGATVTSPTTLSATDDAGASNGGGGSVEDDDDPLMLPNFSPAANPATARTPTPQLGAGAGGLWGSRGTGGATMAMMIPADEADQTRDLSNAASKRRWTFAEQSTG